MSTDPQQPSQADVFAASEPFVTEANPQPGGFVSASLPFVGVDAFNAAGPIPAMSPLPNSRIDASCLDIYRALSVFLDGELAIPQAQAVRSHLTVCGPCQGAQAFQMQLRTTVAAKALDPMPEDVRARITKALGFE
ncbi:MAG: hypothetical protein ACI81L_002459 [Verrucomicrobiales bacterium]|jgi:hypothetical protein